MRQCEIYLCADQKQMPHDFNLWPSNENLTNSKWVGSGFGANNIHHDHFAGEKADFRQLIEMPGPKMHTVTVPISIPIPISVRISIRIPRKSQISSSLSKSPHQVVGCSDLCLLDGGKVVTRASIELLVNRSGLLWTSDNLDLA